MKKGAIPKALALTAAIFSLLFAFEVYSGVSFDPFMGAVGFIAVFFLLLSLMG